MLGLIFTKVCEESPPTEFELLPLEDGEIHGSGSETTRPAKYGMIMAKFVAKQTS